MVTFFVTLNDGTLLVPVDALKEAVQVRDIYTCSIILLHCNIAMAGWY